MITHERLKEKLEKEGCSKYFTKEVYETYLKEKEESLKYFAETGQWLLLKESEQSKFYRKNGYGWCRMLEIIYEDLKKWRIDFFEGSFPWYNLVERRYMHFDTRAEAVSWAKAYRKDCKFDITEAA